MRKHKSDWHPADIIAGLRKQRTTLAALSRSYGLSSSTLANALTRPWPKGEMIIADALGKPANEIWPSRYFAADGCAIERTIRAKNRVKA